MKYSFIATEGIQDVAFISKILKNLGFDRERYKRIIEDPLYEYPDTKQDTRILVNEFWHNLFPKSFPASKDGDFTRGVPLPWFWSNKQNCVAVQGLGGLHKFINQFRLTLSQISLTDVFSIGIILDADSNMPPADRFANFLQDVRRDITGIPPLPDSLSLPKTLGAIVGDAPKTGAFIFPDNTNFGTVEDLLLDCADKVYPNIKEHVGIFVKSENEWSADLDKDEGKEYRKPAGKQKLTVAGISSVMKPGRAVQNTIEDHRWLCDETMSTRRVQGFVDFLKTLLDMQ